MMIIELWLKSTIMVSSTTQNTQLIQLIKQKLVHAMRLKYNTMKNYSKHKAVVRYFVL